MISMDLKQQILHYYRVDELSLREIARRTEKDRKTVTRLINAYEHAVQSINLANTLLVSLCMTSQRRLTNG